MKKTKKDKNWFIKAGVSSATILSIFIVIVFIIANMGITPIPEETTSKWNEFQRFYLGQEAIPAAGASGILAIYFINHSAGNDYKDINTSATLESWCNASGLGYVNADNTELDIAHTTAFDVVVRVRGNSTHCKHGAVWFDSDLNVTMTWSDEGLTNDQPDGQTTSGTAAFNTSAFTYLYVNFYWDNGGSGYTINKGETTNVGDFIYAYFG